MLEPQVALSRELRDELGSHILVEVAGRGLCHLQRSIEPLLAVVPDERLSRYDRCRELPHFFDLHP